MPRNYTRKAPRMKDEDPLAVGGTSRGTNSTRGKKKRASADLDARTIVASNPFDDDDHHHHQHAHQMHANPTHLHQVPLQHQISSQHPHQAMTPTQHHQHHSPAPMAIQAPYGPPMGVQPAGYPQQPMHGPRMHQQQHLVEPPMPPGLMGTPTPPPRTHPMYGGGFQGASGYQVVSPPPQQSQQQPPPPPPQQPAPPPPPNQQQPPQQQQQPPLMHQMEGQPPMAPYQQQTGGQVMVYCGECRQAIYANEPRIVCRAGCDFYYHRHCSGLTELACELLLREAAAEWVCNRCININRQIPVVRIHNQQPADCRQTVW